MRVIITGASGFIGRNLLLKIQEDWEVFAIYNSDSSFLKFVQDNELRNVLPMRCDLTDIEEIKSLSKEIGNTFDICFYLAALVRVRETINNPWLDINISLKGLINFLEIFQGEHFIYMSSGAVYDGLSGGVCPTKHVSPTLPYAISKLTCEQFVQYFKYKRNRISDYTILRFFGAFGPYEPPFKIYTKLVKTFGIERNDTFVILGDGENLIDAMYIEDAVNALIKIAKSKKPINKVVDFASRKPITINSLVETASKVFSVNSPRIIHIGEIPEYITFYSVDDTLEKEIGFKPKYSLEEGLINLYKFLREDKK